MAQRRLQQLPPGPAPPPGGGTPPPGTTGLPPLNGGTRPPGTPTGTGPGGLPGGTPGPLPGSSPLPQPGGSPAPKPGGTPVPGGGLPGTGTPRPGGTGTPRPGGAGTPGPAGGLPGSTPAPVGPNNLCSAQDTVNGAANCRLRPPTPAPTFPASFQAGVGTGALPQYTFPAGGGSNSSGGGSFSIPIPGSGNAGFGAAGGTAGGTPGPNGPAPGGPPTPRVTPAPTPAPPGRLQCWSAGECLHVASGRERHVVERPATSPVPLLADASSLGYAVYFFTSGTFNPASECFVQSEAPSYDCMRYYGLTGESTKVCEPNEDLCVINKVELVSERDATGEGSRVPARCLCLWFHGMTVPHLQSDIFLASTPQPPPTPSPTPVQGLGPKSTVDNTRSSARAVTNGPVYFAEGCSTKGNYTSFSPGGKSPNFGTANDNGILKATVGTCTDQLCNSASAAAGGAQGGAAETVRFMARRA